MAVTSVLLCAATIGYVLFCFKKLSVKTDNKKWFFIISICLLGLSNMLTDSVVLAFLNYVGSSISVILTLGASGLFSSFQAVCLTGIRVGDDGKCSSSFYFLIHNLSIHCFKLSSQ